MRPLLDREYRIQRIRKMRAIYLQIDGKQIGPLPENQVRDLVAKGEIRLDVLSWHEESPNWVPLGHLIGVSVGPPAEPLQHSVTRVNLVQIDGVTKSFGPKIALKNISFTVPAGQICGLLGPNGAGKTTLFRLLMGILKATEGKLLIDDRDAFEDRVQVKRLIGFLPDEPVFYSYLSGREVLELSAAMHGLDVPANMNRMVPVIARLRLADDINNYAEDYSRGMKKKLGLLLAMLHEPKLLVLDEPTNGLDVESTHLFYDLIMDASKLGTTVLFSTHLMDHVAKLCSHAVTINEGTVVAKGSLEELRSKFGQTSLKTFFLSSPRAPPKHDKCPLPSARLLDDRSPASGCHAEARRRAAKAPTGIASPTRGQEFDQLGKSRLRAGDHLHGGSQCGGCFRRLFRRDFRRTHRSRAWRENRRGSMVPERCRGCGKKSNHGV
jgi:ABC-2 type transport system ATP-binding protein